MPEESRQNRRVRVSGTLDMIRACGYALELVLGKGERLRALWTGLDLAALVEHLGRPVVVEGSATFDASGALVRLEADAVAAARPQDAILSKLPEPLGRRLSPEDLRRPQSATTGVNAIWGRWPGPESEEELLAAVQELS